MQWTLDDKFFAIVRASCDLLEALLPRLWSLWRRRRLWFLLRLWTLTRVQWAANVDLTLMIRDLNYKCGVLKGVPLPHSTEYHSSDFFRFQRCQRAIRRPRSPRYATRNLCQYPARIVSWCFLEQQSQRTSKRHSGNMGSSRKNLILVLVSFGWNWSSFLFFLSYLTL